MTTEPVDSEGGAGAEHRRRQEHVLDLMATAAAADRMEVLAPAPDLGADRRVCLGGFHFPGGSLLEEVRPVRDAVASLPWQPYLVPERGLHLTVKNVRVARDPAGFGQEDVTVVRDAFARTLPGRRSFRIYCSRVMVLARSLSIMFTSDPAFDELVGALDLALTARGFGDDKQYVNDSHFVLNLTLARFADPPDAYVRRAVDEISRRTTLSPYVLDSVTLASGSPVMSWYRSHGHWALRS